MSSAVMTSPAAHAQQPSSQTLLPPGDYQFKTSPWSSHSRILAYVMRWPRTTRILDVGTAEGYIGQSLRRAGFTQVVGLERDSTSAASARASYTEVIEGDLDWPATWAWPAGRQFDVVICADVLEHLRDPWSALQRLNEVLVPDGRVLISLPNSGHWWVRLNVLCGRFPLDACGLFDRDHVRFFTWASLHTLLRQSGLAVERSWITPIPFASLRRDGATAWLALWSEMLYHHLARVWKRLLAYQFVLAARRIR